MRPTSILVSVIQALAIALVLRVVFVVMSSYPAYFPPEFSSDFLRGRDGHFFSSYRWSFYAHIISGPITLVLGLALVSESFRMRFPRWHRVLGRVQVACVLLFVAPSGLVMARHAAAGPVAGAGLAALAMATATCAAIGFLCAMRRRFVGHRRWMWRCYLLLCSAVVLGGLATAADVTVPWFDPLADWMSWLAPMAAFEIWETMRGGAGLVDRLVQGGASMPESRRVRYCGPIQG
jgi:hypothetical protein